MSLSLPTVSVVMTTYKEDPVVLRRAVRSILDQTFRELECIVVFEFGDPNCEMLRQEIDDSRLVVFERGLPRNRNACHNKGLELARGRYIARMDGDDYSYPDRIEKELGFLRGNPDVALVGSAGALVDTEGNRLGVRRFPASHAAIIRSFALTNPIFHPSALWDTERVGRDLRYFDWAFFAEDLELWFHMLSRGARFANLPDVLIDYEMPAGYTRPPSNWTTNLRVRWRYRALCLRYPSLALGIMCYCVLVVLPARLVDTLTGRNWFSDMLRSIRS